jgi:hypothetical protein
MGGPFYFMVFIPTMLKRARHFAQAAAIQRAPRVA